MTIRLARLDDIDSMVELGRRIHALSRYAPMAFNTQRVTEALHDIVARGAPKYVLLVATDSAERVVGGLLGVVERALFTDALSASIMHYLVLPEARMGGHAPRLLRAFERWAANRGVADINFGINSGIDAERAGRYARRMGYRAVGEHLVKELK